MNRAAGVSTAPSLDDAWREQVPGWLLTDEPRRRAYLRTVRERAREAGYTGRVRFAVLTFNPELGYPPQHYIEVARDNKKPQLVADHTPPAGFILKVNLPTIALWYKDGVAWHDAPVPSRWHRCKPQTHGLRRLGPIDLEVVDRCACGALRFDGDGPWIDRNERRRPRG